MTTTTATTAGQPRLRALSPRASQIEETPAKRTRELKLRNKKNKWREPMEKTYNVALGESTERVLVSCSVHPTHALPTCPNVSGGLTHRQGHRTLLPRSFREERTKPPSQEQRRQRSCHGRQIKVKLQPSLVGQSRLATEKQHSLPQARRDLEMG